MRIIYINRGIPGSGKSTKAKTLAPKENIFSTDDFWMKGGKYVFEGAKIKVAHEWNQERVEKAMQDEKTPLVVDNTNITYKSYSKYISLAKAYGYIIEYTFPDSPWWKEIYPKIRDKSFKDEDVQVFVEKTVHNVPFATIKNMMEIWEE